MEILIGIIVVAVFVWMISLIGGNSSPPPGDAYAETQRTKTNSRNASRADNLLREHKSMIEERWNLANQETEGYELPRWYFDEVTDRQLDRLQRDGFASQDSTITKGQASDIIGLGCPVEEKEKPILKHFKIPLKGLNQTSAMHQVALLLSKPENIESWKNRPATALQKYFFVLFGQQKPAKLTHAQAEEIIDEYMGEHDSDCDFWDSFECTFDDLHDDPELYDIRKPGFTLYCKAIESLKNKEGSECDIFEDYQTIVDKMIEINPSIEKT